MLIIHRRDARDVALVAHDELNARHPRPLICSDRNAQRLMTALLRARSKNLSGKK
jgi:hypothetical protein